MQRFRIKSIKKMFSLFLWISLVLITICSLFAFGFLYGNIDSAKKSAVNTVCYSADRIISEHMDAITSAETTLHTNRDIQEFLNEATGEDAEMLKVNAADSIRATVNGKDRGLGAALYYNEGAGALLSYNATPEEEAFITSRYIQYLLDKRDGWFMYALDNPLYPEFYICHFKPVVYHSMQVVDSYEVGTMAVFSKINFYELKNHIEENSVMRVVLENSNTQESVSLVDTTQGKTGKETVHTQRIGYTDWSLSVSLLDVIGVSFLSPFLVLSIILLFVLLIYVLLLKKSMRVLVDTPIKKLSTYLEEFMLSKRGRTEVNTVGIDEFDDILLYINKLFGRVTEQARLVVKTQQEMYEQELQASEQALYMNQLQINPHFLFNTLNTITQMCQAKGLDDVTVITHSISEIFRYSTEGDHKATIDEEIYIILKYIKIFNSRYGREFQCELDIQDELYEFEIMKMTLQPLIENSFKHGGIANVDQPLIKISAYYEGEDIVISVLDNGNGIPADKLELLNHDLRVGNTKKNKGIGLLNVNKRLKICYGNESGLEIDSKYGEYTKIIIRIKAEKKS